MGPDAFAALAHRGRQLPGEKRVATNVCTAELEVQRTAGHEDRAMLFRRRNSEDGRGVPQVGTRVRQAGTASVYVVLQVDMGRRLADVRPLTGPRAPRKVPFECLRELERQAA